MRIRMSVWQMQRCRAQSVRGGAALCARQVGRQAPLPACPVYHATLTLPAVAPLTWESRGQGGSVLNFLKLSFLNYLQPIPATAYLCPGSMSALISGLLEQGDGEAW